MKERVILTDCDGCLVSWNTGFDKFMSSKGISRIADTGHSYSLSVRYGLSEDTAHYYVKEFNESSYVKDLEPFADSVEYIKKLADENFRFIVVTSLSDLPQAKYYRTKNLHNIFGDIFGEIVCLEMGLNKEKELSRWQDSGYFWIEDNTQQAEAGHRAGLKSILIDHPYNAHYKTDLFTMVDYEQPWEEIYDIVRTEYNL